MATDETTNAKLVDIAHKLASQGNADPAGGIKDKGQYLRNFRTYFKHLRVSTEQGMGDSIDWTEAELTKLHPPKVDPEAS
jgi:hypothetical protein